MTVQSTQTVVVLFTRYNSLFSDFISFISGGGYTHASISLDKDSERYYSFNRKGFRKESPRRHKLMRRKATRLYLEVSEDSYARIRRKLEAMNNAWNLYEYSRLGVLTCLLQIPWKRRRHYFCSQFVGEVLELADNIKLKKHTSLYLPHQLAVELQNHPCLKHAEIAHFAPAEASSI